MMTSLARQLERLAVPYTQSVYSQDKKRASLLFDPKEAANLDREAVFAIGQCGLEELQNANPVFIDFEATLFNLSSKNWERSLQTKEVNEQLDETIHRFLILLSPYFPLKSSHKVLEWLIYRYHIHQYNRDDLVLCVLPYHEMKVFVRLLQLIKLSDPTDKWNWLEPSIKNGVPLPRGTLVNHCCKDPGFMSFVLEMVPAFIKVHGAQSSQLRAIIALYTCAVLGTLRHKHNVTERVLSIVVPHLVRGFKSKSVEYKAANYMVLSQLVVQVPLKADLLQSLLPVLTKHIAPQLAKEALACLGLIFQTQKMSSLPKKSFKHICKMAGIIPLLTDLSQRYNMDGLLQAWTDRLIPVAIKEGDSGAYSSSDGGEEISVGKPLYATLLHEVITEVNIVHNTLKVEVIRKILENLVQRKSALMETEEAHEEWLKTTKTLVSVLERRYSTALETAIQEVMSRLESDESSMEVLQEILSLSNFPIKYQHVPEASTNIFFGLKHHSAYVRVSTLKHISKYLGDHQDSSIDSLQELLLERLCDDDVTVVKAVLDLHMSWPNIIKPEQLMELLLERLKKWTGKSEWFEVYLQAVRVVCSLTTGSQDTEVCLELLPHVIVLDTDSMAPAEVIIMEGRRMFYTYLKIAKREWSPLAKDTDVAKSQMPSRLNEVFFRSVSSYLVQCSAQAFPEVVDKIVEKSSSSPLYNFFALCVLGDVVTKVGDRKLIIAIEGLIQLLPSHEKYETEVPKDLIVDVEDRTPSSDMYEWTGTLIHTEGQGVPSTLYTWCSYNLTTALTGLKLQGEGLHLAESPIVASLIKLLSILIKPNKTSTRWQPVLLDLINTKLPMETTMKLLSYIWISKMEDKTGIDIAPVLHVGSFYIFRHIVQGLKNRVHDINVITANGQTVCMSLLLSLLHPHVSVVQATFRCLETLQDNCDTIFGSLKQLVAQILKRTEEITADRLHTPHVVGKYFAKRLMESPKKRKKMLSEAKDCLKALLQLISSADTPVNTKNKLLQLLSEIPHDMILDDLVPLANNIMMKCPRVPNFLVASHMNILGHVIVRFDETTALTLKLDSAALDTFLKALTTSTGVAGADTPQEMALNQLSLEFFRNLPELDVQQKVVSTLLDAGEKVDCPKALNLLKSCLRSLKLRGIQMTHELTVKGDDVSTVKGKKKTRATSERIPLNYKRLIFLLEVVQIRKKVKDTVELATVLFALLVRLDQDDAEETEYTKQLVLSCLLNLCTNWTTDTKPQTQEILNIESLVKCIRTSPSPQTQQLAMMVMSAIAPLYPDYILHNVMSIFTFMGTNLVQQDDSYSFQLISRTIDTVIPALIQACSDVEEESLIQNILRVFIDARQHIPKHRSMVLFHQLAEKIGHQRHLWKIVVLFMESSVRTKDVPSIPDTVVDITEQGRSAIDKDIDLTVNICGQFHAELQLQTLTDVLKFLNKLTKHLIQIQQHQGIGTPARRKSKMAAPVPVLALETLNAQQLRLIEYHVTRVIVAILSKEDFISSILKQTTDGSMTEELSGHFREFLHQCLDVLSQVSKGYGSFSSTATGKFWRAVLHKVYDILDRVNYLLPHSMFLTVVSSLLKHDNMSIRRKSLELLNNKLQTVTMEMLDQEQVTALLAVLPGIVDVASCHTKSSGEPESSDSTALCQMALFSLKLLCKLLGQNHPTHFTQMFNVTLAILTGPDQPGAILSSALLCIAELCASLKAHALPYLSKFMPPLLTLLKDTELLLHNELLLVCSLTMLQKVVATLPHFLSPHLLDVVRAICQLSCLIDQSSAAKKTQPCIRLRAVKHQVASAVAPRVLIPILTKSMGKLLKKNQKALVPLFEIAREHIEAIDKDDLPAHQVSLVTFFCDSLDLRNTDLSLSWEEVMKTEEYALDMVLALVMRLSENSFRPMFYKLYDWACREDTQIEHNRQITFFRLAERLSDALRGLFNLFIGHSVKAACSLLEKNNTSHGEVSFYGTDEEATKKSCLVLGYIMGCFHKCFLHDTENLVDKEMFMSLVQPLVGQLENLIGGEAAYEERITNHVTPCISQLAVATQDDSSWKVLNYQVLLKTRHVSPKVRFASLQTVEDIATKLGEDYMTLLPETVPFLAELMEDDSEEVEQKCQQVVTSLEQLLGESIQQYF